MDVCVLVLWHQGVRGEAGERGATGFPGARGPGGQKASDCVATKSTTGSIQHWPLKSLTDTLPSAPDRATLVYLASLGNRSVLFAMQLKCWFILSNSIFPWDYLGLAAQTKCKSGRCFLLQGLQGKDGQPGWKGDKGEVGTIGIRGIKVDIYFICYCFWGSTILSANKGIEN